MWLALLLGCTDAPVEETAATDPCADAPTVTYETFGAGFLRENCQSCHASTSPNRNGAPEVVVFDTVEDAWRFAERILAVAAADPASMPPLGGTTLDDRERLRIWLTCAEEGT